MKLSSKSTQRAFVRSPWLRIGSLVVVSLLLIASLFGVGKAFSKPVKSEQPTVVVNYEHSGKFDYLVYLKPNSLYGPTLPEKEKETEEETPPVFFRDIIDEVRLAFSYRFDCGESTASISNDVVVTIIAENPGMWQKEMKQLEQIHKGKDFRVDFPLFLNSLDDVVDDIEEDIGVSSSVRNFIIRAVVHTTAETASGKTIEDDFSHEITAILKTKTLELQGDLKGEDTGVKEGVSYKEEGWFDYEVYLKSNKLYGPIVLRSEGLPVAESAETAPQSQTLEPGLVYFPRIIDDIKVSFSYRFNCDRPVENLIEEVRVVALLEYPQMWSKSFILVPETRKSGAFTVDFPLDVSNFNKVADTLRNELGFGAATYDLTIQAVVHITADTDSGRIDEVFSQEMEGKLGTTTLIWKSPPDRKQPGTIEESGIVAVPDAYVFRVLSLVILALVVFGFLFVVWNTRQVRALAMSRMDKEVFRTRRKYKNVVVDVGELPPTSAGEVVIAVGSVDELVKTADALLKPVLHQVGVDKHTYCVIDGSVRYQYVSEP